MSTRRTRRTRRNRKASRPVASKPPTPPELDLPIAEMLKLGSSGAEDDTALPASHVQMVISEMTDPVQKAVVDWAISVSLHRKRYPSYFCETEIAQWGSISWRAVRAALFDLADRSMSLLAAEPVGASGTIVKIGEWLEQAADPEKAPKLGWAFVPTASFAYLVGGLVGSALAAGVSFVPEAEFKKAPPPPAAPAAPAQPKPTPIPAVGSRRRALLDTLAQRRRPLTRQRAESIGGRNGLYWLRRNGFATIDGDTVSATAEARSRMGGKA